MYGQREPMVVYSCPSETNDITQQLRINPVNPGGMQVEFSSWGRVKRRTVSEPPAGSHQWGEGRKGGEGTERGITPG